MRPFRVMVSWPEKSLKWSAFPLRAIRKSPGSSEAFSRAAVKPSVSGIRLYFILVWLRPSMSIRTVPPSNRRSWKGYPANSLAERGVVPRRESARM